MIAIEQFIFAIHLLLVDNLNRLSKSARSNRMYITPVAWMIVLSLYVRADTQYRETEWTEAAETLLFEGMTVRRPIKILNSLEIRLANGVFLKMVKVENGTFRMGPKDNFYSHAVTIRNDYWIGCYEITRIQYKTVMGENKVWLKKEDEELPQVNVNWKSAKDFCDRLNKLSRGQRPYAYYFELPTEAQWEYAASGGKNSKHYIYSGGDNPSEVAWYQQTSDGKPHKVGLTSPNELGIFDMSGNVGEWCLDRFGEYSGKTEIDPQGPKWGKGRVNRGGSFNDRAEKCAVTYRNQDDPSPQYGTIGFRVVMVLDETQAKKDESAKRITEEIKSKGDAIENKVKSWLKIDEP